MSSVRCAPSSAGNDVSVEAAIHDFRSGDEARYGACACIHSTTVVASAGLCFRQARSGCTTVACLPLG